MSLSLDKNKSGKVSGVVLCGGKGTRMGGVNKGLVLYRGKPLFLNAVANLKKLTDHVIVNSNSEQAVYQAQGFEVIDDGDYSYLGPLAGIYAGLQAVSDYSDWVVFAPCDQLPLPEHVYETLLSTALQSESPHPVAVYARGRVDAHPLCCVVPVSLMGQLKEALDENSLRVQGWMEQNGLAVEFSDIRFANINEPGNLVSG